MHLYIVIGLYAFIFILTMIFFVKYLRKNIFLSFLASLIIGQFMLIFLSFFGVFSKTSNTTSSSELIFWCINLLTPFIIYGALLYIIYTKNI